MGGISFSLLQLRNLELGVVSASNSYLRCCSSSVISNNNWSIGSSLRCVLVALDGVLCSLDSL